MQLCSNPGGHAESDPRPSEEGVTSSDHWTNVCECKCEWFTSHFRMGRMWCVRTVRSATLHVSVNVYQVWGVVGVRRRSARQAAGGREGRIEPARARLQRALAALVSSEIGRIWAHAPCNTLLQRDETQAVAAGPRRRRMRAALNFHMKPCCDSLRASHGSSAAAAGSCLLGPRPRA